MNFEHVCVCTRAVAQLLRECIWRKETSRLQVQVTVIASYGILSLISKQETCTQLLLLTQEYNEYLVIDRVGQDRWLDSSNIMQQTGLVPELHHSQCSWMTLSKLQVDCSAGP